MLPTIGRIVLYTLSQFDVDAINFNRQNSPSPNAGNFANAGDTYPAVVVRVFGGDAANLQVLLDGPDTYWATSRPQGEAGEQGRWNWPPRV
ncbi:hypothetical protein GA0070622_1200 [Micromonospora sediminicola]|uniref:Uncharacterized protein n=1 Tax=Micromonospora sediminicola TaxID=946078 RepID=A0A1A9B412_9ACTN|nr:hypothetical protein [Micromonospora sediminicola]SBT64230.1 hypothetical protein GA0070622_1200 [Micromonospora sediminicola]